MLKSLTWSNGSSTGKECLPSRISSELPTISFAWGFLCCQFFFSRVIIFPSLTETTNLFHGQLLAKNAKKSTNISAPDFSFTLGNFTVSQLSIDTSYCFPWIVTILLPSCVDRFGNIGISMHCRKFIAIRVHA